MSVTTAERRRALMSLKKASDVYGVPYSSLRDAHLRGELAVVRLGASERYAAWYVRPAEVERWISSRTARSA